MDEIIGILLGGTEDVLGVSVSIGTWSELVLTILFNGAAYGICYTLYRAYLRLRRLPYDSSHTGMVYIFMIIPATVMGGIGVSRLLK